MNWKPGDIALVKIPELSLDILGLNGEIVTLKARAPQFDWQATDGTAWIIESGGCVAEHCLHPIYDGNEKTTWEDSVWRPQKDLVSIHEQITHEQASILPYSSIQTLI